MPGKLFTQFLGGFVGAAIVYINYRSAIAAWDPEYAIPGGSILSPTGDNSAGIFSTYPSAFFNSNWEAAFQELLGSASLMFGPLSISDPMNSSRFPAPQISIFILLVGIGTALGWQTGYLSSSPSPPKIIHFHERLTADVFQAINPARDFGPRLFSAIIYGSEVFTVRGYYCFVPLFVPIFGCLLGASVYNSMLFEGEGSAVTDVVDKLDSDRSGELRLD
jgi:aquaglyceroporin related protein